jgi:hypothetical protein
LLKFISNKNINNQYILVLFRLAVCSKVLPLKSKAPLGRFLAVWE